MSARQSLYTMLKFGVSCALIAYIFYIIDVRDVADVFRMIPLPILLWGIILQLISVGISALKWKVLLPEHSIRTLIKYSFVGQLYSLVLPGQFAGEIAKGIRLGQGAGFNRIVSSVLVDKVTGVIGLALVFLYGVFSSAGVSWSVIAIAGSTTLIGSLFFILFRSTATYRMVVRIIQNAGRVHTVFEKPCGLLIGFLESCRVHSQRTHALFMSVLLGIVFQCIAVLITYTMALGVGIHTVTFADWCWIFGVVSIIVLLPITIAGLGVREISFVHMLSLFAVQEPAAVALSFSLLGLQLIIAVIGGIIELFPYGNTATSHTI